MSDARRATLYREPADLAGALFPDEIALRTVRLLAREMDRDERDEAA